jgi:hypothetical protein
MPRFRSSFLLTLAFLFSAGSARAGNSAVGTCKPKLPSFSTISRPDNGNGPGGAHTQKKGASGH